MIIFPAAGWSLWAKQGRRFGGETVEAERVQLAYLAALDKTFAAVNTANDICGELAVK